METGSGQTIVEVCLEFRTICSGTHFLMFLRTASQDGAQIATGLDPNSTTSTYLIVHFLLFQIDRGTKV